MVNAVSESGNYWIANNFIWGWLLVPVTALAEMIKKNRLRKPEAKNTWNYCSAIAGCWIASMPFWNWFLTGPMASDAGEILKIVCPLMPYYAAYTVSACIDGWFISRGKTVYNMLNSAIVNVLYYGTVYVLFRQGFISMNLTAIVRMFGIGMAVHLVCSLIFYRYEQKLEPARSN